MEYKAKYVNKSSRKPGETRGRKVNNQGWKTPTDPVERDRYYAWLKHRSQAWYRGEEYEITYDQWIQIWPIDLFLRRGRTSDAICLSRIDWDQPWSYTNCEVVSRLENLRRQGYQRHKK